MVSVTDHYGRILGFVLTRLSGPVPDHYSTDNLVVPGIEPGPLYL
jgi:hypothetical protein